MLTTAQQQRVAPLVLRSFDRAGIDAGADAERARQEAAFRRAQELVSLPALMRHGLAPLDAAGLRPLLYKGGALVGRYPAPGLRPMDDVDIVLPAEQVPDAIAVLEQAGWRRGIHGRADQVRRRPVFEDPDYDVPMIHPETGGLPLELHHDLHRRWQRTNDLDAACLWDARSAGVLGDQPVWTVPPELELLALAAHAAKPFHAFSRLIWAVDLVVVMEASEIAWDEVARLAAKLRCRTALAVGLRLAERLGAVVPEDLSGLSGLAGRAGVLDPVLDPAWPFQAQDRNRGGFGLALVDDNRTRALLMVDRVLRGKGGRPNPRSIGHLGSAAVRTVRRMAVRGR